MCKKILIIVLLIVIPGARADWIKVYSDEAETHYADPTLIRIDHKTIMVDVTDSTVNEQTISIKAHRQYDCKNKRVRLLGLTGFKGSMGEGDEIFSNSTHEKWQTLKRKTAMANLFRLVCGKNAAKKLLD